MWPRGRGRPSMTTRQRRPRPVRRVPRRSAPIRRRPRERDGRGGHRRGKRPAPPGFGLDARGVPSGETGRVFVPGAAGGGERAAVVVLLLLLPRGRRVRVRARRERRVAVVDANQHRDGGDGGLPAEGEADAVAIGAGSRGQEGNARREGPVHARAVDLRAELGEVPDARDAVAADGDLGVRAADRGVVRDDHLAVLAADRVPAERPRATEGGPGWAGRVGASAGGCQQWERAGAQALGKEDADARRADARVPGRERPRLHDAPVPALEIEPVTHPKRGGACPPSPDERRRSDRI